VVIDKKRVLDEQMLVNSARYQKQLERQEGGLGHWDRYNCADRSDLGPPITSNDLGVFRAGQEYGACVERAKLHPRFDAATCVDFASP
jgi:hypothetical protein